MKIAHHSSSALSAIVLCFLGSVSAAPTPGEVAFSTDFDSAAERESWKLSKSASWVEESGRGTVLRVDVNPESIKEAHSTMLPIDLSDYRGCTLIFECQVKADGVTKPSASYLGAKFMLHYDSESEGPLWTNESNVYGTFDWRRSSFTVRIAPDARDAHLSLSLQDSSGKAYFDAIRVTVFKVPHPRPTPITNPPPAFKGHTLSRLRGVMSPNSYFEEDLKTLGTEWGANLIRWQITRHWGQKNTDRDLKEYGQWIDVKLAELDQTLEACRRYGIFVLIDLHTPPGGWYENKDMAIFHEKKYQDYWVSIWEKIARRYKGNSVVWGYDLINEPIQTRSSPDGVADYLAGQKRVADAIRRIDPDTPIIVEAAESDSARGYRDLEPINVPNVIYQVHLYTPGEFTHQGVYGEWKPVNYPGKIAGREWNKEELRKVLEPVREFQRAYNVHIYAGEFSAVRWAPGAVDYLRDCIELFEEYGWDWSYHAYREWDGWSVEHGSNIKDHQKVLEPTDRKQLLLKWFAQNEKPSF